MHSVSQMFDLAVQHHQAGDLHQAESLYRQILQIDPRHSRALHLFGVIAHQVGKNDLAIDCIQRALRLQPDFPAAHNNLGLALMAQGKLVEALASFRQAVRQRPDYADAYNNLGNALKEQGKLDEALTNYQQALRLKPDDAGVYNNVGNVLKEQRKLEEAIASYQQALRLKPDLAEAYNNLGVVLNDQGKFEEAITSSRQALRLKPDFAEAYINLGNALSEQGKLEDAIANHWQALRLKPDLAETHKNLGTVLTKQGKLEEAISCYEQALRLQPSDAAAYNNLGIALREQGKLDEAIASCQNSLRLKPDSAEAYVNLGNVLRDQARLHEAIEAYRASLARKADGAHIHSNLVYTLVFHPDYDPAEILAECRRWELEHAQPLTKLMQPHANDRSADRRLRIGYVSPDFCNHAESFFTVPLLSSHDHSQAEIFCYADVVRPDAVTERIRGYADVWHNTLGRSDEQVAELIRSDRIDILVDLTMHMAKNRLLVFARKPAPVQVTWLAYPGTTGLSTMDYRLTDPYLDPAGLFDACYAEKSIRLPDTWTCYEPLTDEPQVTPLPALQNGVITFGCLNTFCKINDGCLALWAKVLRAVPGSRLLLLAPQGTTRDHVLAIFEQAEVAASRVELIGRQPRPDYLRLYHRIDVCLDPLPYNGITTSLDAFWMGVPTLTLVGKTAAGRAGWSQLCNLGLRELAAQTPEEHVEIAANLACDLPRLQDLRQTLRARLLRSPLMDGPRFARNVEHAFRQMWQRWCRVS